MFYAHSENDIGEEQNVMGLQMKNQFVAHIRANADGSWSIQSLEDHLKAVAKIAGEFSETFGNRDWGELLGHWHDLGKFLPAWQAYIRRETGFDEDAHIENSRQEHWTGRAHARARGLKRSIGLAAHLSLS